MQERQDVAPVVGQAPQTCLRKGRKNAGAGRVGVSLWQGDEKIKGKALLAQAGDTYLPFLKANADALAAGAGTFEVKLEGARYAQGVFKYQAKCLDTLRSGWNALNADDRATLRGLIGEGAAILD